VKLLLDTHAFIWWDGDQTKLSAKVLAACQSPTNTLHISLASVWEMQIKAQLGKLTAPSVGRHPARTAGTKRPAN
jgi:PIN domain nuclease of toxin-antitoxin system